MKRGSRLYFFWDYDVTEEDLRRILRSSNRTEKAWAISRILERCKWEDIWNYLTVEDIRTTLPYLKMRPKVKALWGYAIQRWSNGLPGNTDLSAA